MLLLIALLAAAPQASTATPNALVDTIYRHYRSGGGGMGDDRVLALLSPTTRALYDRALARDSEEVVIEADPFCDCQDFADIRVEAVRIAPVRAGRTTASVRIVDKEMDDGPRTIAIKLIQTPQGWRVEDVSAAGGAALLSQIKPTQPTPTRRRR